MDCKIPCHINAVKLYTLSLHSTPHSCHFSTHFWSISRCMFWQHTSLSATPPTLVLLANLISVTMTLVRVALMLCTNIRIRYLFFLVISKYPTWFTKKNFFLCVFISTNPIIKKSNKWSLRGLPGTNGLTCYLAKDYTSNNQLWCSVGYPDMKHIT